MSFVERRQSPRADDHHLIVYTHYDDRGDVDDQNMARTLDVSMGGLLLETVRPISPGSRLSLEMQLGEDILSLQARVVHVGELPNGRFRVGVALENVSEDLLVRIEAELCALLDAAPAAES